MTERSRSSLDMSRRRSVIETVFGADSSIGIICRVACLKIKNRLLRLSILRLKVRQFFFQRRILKLQKRDAVCASEMVEKPLNEQRSENCANDCRSKIDRHFVHVSDVLQLVREDRVRLVRKDAVAFKDLQDRPAGQAGWINGWSPEAIQRLRVAENLPYWLPHGVTDEQIEYAKKSRSTNWHCVDELTEEEREAMNAITAAWNAFTILETNIPSGVPFLLQAFQSAMNDAYDILAERQRVILTTRENAG